jgi:hypothetical protein
VGQFFGLSALTELLGFLLAVTTLFGTISPVLAGLSFDLTGDYLVALVTACVIFASAGVLSVLLKPPAEEQE